MEGAEAENKPILKDAESVENDQPQSKETGPMKSKGQSKCGCDGPSTTKTRSSREEKLKKKDDKSVEHVLKALNSLNTTEEKLAAMCKKYADIFDENRKVQLALKQSEKRNGALQREKEQLQADQSKSILTRSRLENLCRELQRQNKAIKDESLSKIREEEEKRKEVSAKFQSTLSEINNLMQQNSDKNSKLRDDNLDMNARLKSVCEQYELREKEVDRIAKQMQLESQLAEAKLAKAKMEMAAERELFVREKQQLLVEITQYQARCQEFQTNEINLRKQISLYNEKYDEFQKALAKSNEVFGGFKVEMDKMSKKIIKLEKETITWKQRWENSHQALLSMADDKQRCDQELGLVSRKLGALQGLCRTLQAERTAMLARLKEAGLKSDDPLMANGDATAEIDADKDQEPQTVVNKKPTPDQTSTKCLKNSAKKCIKDRTPVSEDAVHVNGQSGDGELKSEVNGSTAVSDVNGSPPKIDDKSEVKDQSNDGVCSEPQDNILKGDVCLKKDPTANLDVDHKPGSEQISANSQEVKKEESPADPKQGVCDLKNVPADSKQPKSKACKRNSRLTSPPKDVAAAKESTVTCQKSPPRVQSPPKVVCAKESTVTCQKSPPRVQSPPKVACAKESTVTCQKSPPRVQSPPKCTKESTPPKVACAKESTVTCQKSPPRVQSPPKVACAKESTPSKGEAAKESTPSSPTTAKDSIATSLEATKAGASSQKAANSDAKKAKDSKKKKK
ncbi:LOW QUALITY PROTEIN: alpha-taxilin [Nilaparvata lugens]|uniref:LOW QUALITY PROTEIN: alpha-taxilin n=1 Tax=Nilaparvata lugens TaxID=108931 RepID=UPI00193CD453|nr:LOW QUALITY PROTEIN: alpha-taxilin [Nilaparvata lugens]